MLRTDVCAAIVTSLLLATTHGDDFPQIYNSEPEESPPMPAAAAAAQFTVPPGFKVGVYAHEPNVQNPIDMAWDARGRIWIAENYTYAEKTQRFDLTLRDRVVILDDKDRDGVADSRTVFTDEVQMLTSVEVGHGGVWLMCPPRLLFIPDADRDDVPDGPVQAVLDGFEVAKENYHNFANGLRWGPDGWLYGRCGGSCPGRIGRPGTPVDQRVALEGGIWRFHPQTSQVEVLAHGTTNPWGHDWDEFGEGFFINTVNGHLWHLIPGAHLDRPFTLDPNPYVYELLDMHADHWHFETGSKWQDSRDGAANAYGGGHAHCGMMIYLGDNWPAKYRGRLLTWNIHGRRANQELLQRHGSGYVGRHGKDMLLSADPFFRGMDLSYGPDGTVYIIDWSDAGECHEHTGVHRTSGRIFRVSYTDAPTKSIDLRSLSDSQLAELIGHGNHWYPRMAQLILAERAEGRDVEPKAIEFLRQAVDGQNPVVSYRALMMLHVAGAADANYLRRQLSHPNEHLRAWAIRLLTDAWPLDDVLGPFHAARQQARRVESECDALLDRLREIATHDRSSLVRLTLASTLQRMPVSRRAALARRLMEHEEDADDHNLPLVTWYGLIPVAEANPTGLASVAVESKWPKTQRLIARRLGEQIDEHPVAVQRLLAKVAQTSNLVVRQNLLAGLSDGLKGWRRALRPRNWDQVVASLRSSRDRELQATVRDLSVLFGDGRALREVRQIVLDEDADAGVRRSALQTLVSAGQHDIVDICLPLLDEPKLNVVAAKGLARSDAPKVAEALIKHYKKFRSPHRPQVIEMLVSRRSFADRLLSAIEDGKIDANDLTAFDVRQIRTLNDASLDRRVSKLWGEVRQTPAERRQLIEDLKEQLNEQNLAKADPGQGRLLFNQSCAKCHKLFGHGESTGPDLTGGNRSNLDYLLENVVDPSGVVSKDFRMTTIETIDGRTLNGLVVSQNDKTLTLQTQVELQTIPLREVVEMNKTPNSPMPDGLLDNLSETQIRNLIAYLMQPSQVRLPE